ncbi:MAG: hypothetical protein ATN32_10525 [Candidatus Epulonipiscium fishelsonii]|nr:MAG: hypothetical protein ATN32_10525 [Epulopiscium sp. AS2M-Bin002]
MRIKLEFKIDKSEMNKDYRRYFVSWIKKALSETNEGKYFEMYYKDTIEKPFTFVVNFRDAKFIDNKIEFKGNTVKMYFSIGERDRRSFIFLSCFLKMKHKEFKLSNGNTMKLINVRQLNVKTIQNDRVIFKTVKGSSVVLREHNRETNKDKYYTVEDADYKQQLEASIKRQCLRNGYTDDEVDKIKVNDVQGNKLVIKNYNNLIDTVAGVFDIYAPNYILNELYLTGLGSRRSFGFSYFEVIERVE